MITPSLVIGIILASIGTVVVLSSIYFVFMRKEPLWIIGFAVGVLLSIAPGAAMIDSVPTKQDVLDGNAHYVKELNVFNNDTVVTYHIEFNKY